MAQLPCESSALVPIADRRRTSNTGKNSSGNMPRWRQSSPRRWIGGWKARSARKSIPLNAANCTTGNRHCGSNWKPPTAMTAKWRNWPSKRLNSENLEFSLRKPFNLLRDQKLVPLIGASGTPMELFTKGIRNISSKIVVGPRVGRCAANASGSPCGESSFHCQRAGHDPRRRQAVASRSG